MQGFRDGHQKWRENHFWAKIGTLGVKHFDKIALSRLIPIGHQKLHKSDLAGKSPEDSADTLGVKKISLKSLYLVPFPR